MSTSRPLAQYGMTLIELIVFIVVVSVGLVGVLSVFNLVVRNSADPLVNKQALAVADAMLEEILLKDFANPSGGYAAACPGTCDRSQFDDVQDYNGYTSEGARSLSDPATKIAGLGSYNVAVAVAPPSAATAAAVGVAAASIQQITVTVTYGPSTYSLTGYRFDYD
jgi:MSHA pilin protein MshD